MTIITKRGSVVAVGVNPLTAKLFNLNFHPHEVETHSNILNTMEQWIAES